MTSFRKHVPVMLDEIISHFGDGALSNKKMIDATFGFGGHSKYYCAKGVQVLGFEYDPIVFKESTSRNKYSNCVIVNENFSKISEIARMHGFDKVDLILFDLGLNMSQQTSLRRGFSFQNSGADLDMRINPWADQLKASDLLNGLREEQLKQMFRQFDIKEASKLARLIVEKRKEKIFQTVSDILEVVDRLTRKNMKLHPATKVFLALRSVVNGELTALENALGQSMGLLAPGGKIAVISFHSGEDRIVKKVFREFADSDKFSLITKKPELPSMNEINTNPSARSAKLRVIKKL